MGDEICVGLKSKTPSIKKEIQEIKDKAAGMDGLLGELLKYGGEIMVNTMCKHVHNNVEYQVT